MESETEMDSEDENQPTQIPFGENSQSLFDESAIQRQFAQTRKMKIDNELEKYQNLSSTYFSTCKYCPFKNGKLSVFSISIKYPFKFQNFDRFLMIN